MPVAIAKRDNVILKGFSKFTEQYAIVIAIFILFVVFSITSEHFFTFTNIRNLFLQTSPVAIVAIGQAYVILSGDFDLSLGQNLCLTSILAAWMMRMAGINPWLSLSVAIVLGCVIGACNGLLIAYGKIPCFVATLGLQMVCRGFARIITNAAPIPSMPPEIGFIGRGFIGGARYGVPVSVVIMLVLFAIFIFISRKTRFGRTVHAIGGNREAAYFAGINVKLNRCLTFTFAGGMSAIGGIVLLTRLDGASITNGHLYEFDTIISCVIGGISLTGGKGRVVQALLGAFFLILFFNGMTMLNIHSFVQDVLRGIVLIGSVAIDVIRNRKRR